MKKYLFCIAMLFMAAFCLTSCGGDEVDVAGGSLAKTSWVTDRKTEMYGVLLDVHCTLSFMSDKDAVMYAFFSYEGEEVGEVNTQIEVVDFDGKSGQLICTAMSEAMPWDTSTDRSISTLGTIEYDAEQDILILSDGIGEAMRLKRTKYQPLEFIDFTTGNKEDPAETKQVFVENGREVPIVSGEINVKERAEGCVRLMFYTKNGTIEVAVDDSYLGKKIDLSKYDDQTLNSFYIDAEGPDFPNDDEDRLYGAESGMQADEGGYLIVKELEKNKQYEVEAAYTHDGSSYKLSFNGEVSKGGNYISYESNVIGIKSVSCKKYVNGVDFEFIGYDGEDFLITTGKFSPGVEYDLTEEGTTAKWYSMFCKLSHSDEDWDWIIGAALMTYPESGTLKYEQKGDAITSVRVKFEYRGEHYSVTWDGSCPFAK